MTKFFIKEVGAWNALLEVIKLVKYDFTFSIFKVCLKIQYSQNPEIRDLSRKD